MNTAPPQDAYPKVNYSRRTVLTLLAGAVAVSSLTVRYMVDWTSESDLEPGAASSVQDSLTAYWDAALVMGRLYLAQYPQEDDYQNLANELNLSEEAIAGAISWPEIKIQQLRLQERHQADFAAGRTIMLGGWILSLTEVRLAALIAKVSHE